MEFMFLPYVMSFGWFSHIFAWLISVELFSKITIQMLLMWSVHVGLIFRISCLHPLVSVAASFLLLLLLLVTLDSVSRVFGIVSLSFGNCWFFCPQSVDVFVRFYRRWKETEAIEAQLLNFSLEESQCEHDWAILLSLASQPGKTAVTEILLMFRCGILLLLRLLVKLTREI